MNLRAAANRMTSGVNPNLSATVRMSTGSATSPSGKRAPTYAAPTGITVQMQALTKKEIEHLDSLNISNAHAALYSNTQLTGVDRVTGSGGDLVNFGATGIPAPIQNSEWLVVAVLEGWVTAGWGKVAVSRQMAVTQP